ncbi:hypothetical protein RB595_004709 [Gaeumannomyces hyphopodioides]
MAPPPEGPASSSSGGSTSSSTIRVFVRWHDQTVFAGEEVKCTITFRNVAAAPNSAGLAPSPGPAASKHHGAGGSDRRKSHPSPLLVAAQARQAQQQIQQHQQQHQHQHQHQPKTPSAGLAPPLAVTRGHHRSSQSISGPPLARSRSGSVTWPPSSDAPGSGATAEAGQQKQDHQQQQQQQQGNGSSGGGHRRSISIVSLGSPTPSSPGQRHDQGGGGGSGSVKSPRPHRGHGRSSSLQINSRSPTLNGPRSASHPQRPPFHPQPSPLLNASYPPSNSSGPSTTPNTPGLGIGLGSGVPSPRPTPEALSGFKFPATQTPLLQQTSEDDLTTPVDEDATPMVGAVGGQSPRSSSYNLHNQDQPIPIINESDALAGAAAAVARVLSTSSISGTPRSSTDGGFYSVSNNSTETLASEYVTTLPHRTASSNNSSRPLHLRQRSNLSVHHHRAKVPEALMMGYAQIQGSFTLDGSLIDLAPFEQVKRKAVVGGQGGGVIGVESQASGARRESGLLRSFGWGSITSSIGELLGGGELSTIKEMRGIAGAKAVPLLSTPQSILFVDLRLAPGESRTFEYSFRLPKGLPPTHKGKAMKVSYSLVVGTQRPGGAKEQQLKSVDVPFRVLGSVNSHGEILGHDLMAPYVLLKDLAHVRTLEEGAAAELLKKKPPAPPSSSTMAGFLAYVDELVHRPNQGPHQSLLSPTVGHSGYHLSPSPTATRRFSAASSLFDEMAAPNSPAADTPAKEAIDMAILRSNLTSAGQQSANRFEIARNGRRVGVVTLARPAWRLGEAVTMTVDFSQAQVPCYALHAALETAERVDPSLALRSEASVHRVTRRVYATSSEAAMYARRIVFSPTIPVTATPEFVTSGISLEWKVRLEFVVPSTTAAAMANHMPPPPSPLPSHSPNNGGGGGGDNDNDDEHDNNDDDDDDSDTGSRRTERAPLATPGGNSNSNSNSYGYYAGGGGQQQHGGHHPLLEEVARDDRGGLVLVAAETLPCESFEVAVPLRVYGAVCSGLERLERDEAESGLVV